MSKSSRSLTTTQRRTAGKVRRERIMARALKGSPQVLAATRRTSKEPATLSA